MSPVLPRLQCSRPCQASRYLVCTCHSKPLSHLTLYACIPQETRACMHVATAVRVSNSEQQSPLVESLYGHTPDATPPLSPLPCSQFYYEAIDRALEEIKERHPGQGVHIVGHSIGGWVARAWLAEGCSPTDRENVLSLTTLGTPNTGPPEDAGGPWTAVDQTRGLLKSINARFPGAHVEGVRYTSVAGTALEGEFYSVRETGCFVCFRSACIYSRSTLRRRRDTAVAPCELWRAIALRRGCFLAYGKERKGKGGTP